jgi:hypothetical protein
MTKEEAIIHIGTLRTVTKDIPKYSGKAIDEAVDMAIKALRQEDILDKIRTEMEEHAYLVSHTAYTIGLPLFSILKIIDKYKMKSEE